MDGSQLAKPPKNISVQFSEGVEPALSELTLLDNANSIVALNPTTFSDDKHGMTFSPVLPLAAGVYRVQWKALSQDGHPVSGEFSFTVSP
ncbi:copper resistance protein CopC (plasmid) [Rhizobium sp. T1470]|uniref:copper resistance CopC family protein n=1 Tax=unclassified Rhizobium TaxID=2613769 RepID=UPI001AAFC147